MKLVVITINKDGERLAGKLKDKFPDAKVVNGHNEDGPSTKELVMSLFKEYEGLIFIAALGITVRLIAPLVKSKFSDPAVVCVDTAGRYSISVLSGHEGGANDLAFLAASCTDAAPVITTGHEVHKKFILGIGTRRGIGHDDVKRAVMRALKKAAIKPGDIRLAATVDLKKDEAGLIDACSEMGLPLVFFSKRDIANFKGYSSRSDVVRRHLGLEGVCEPCALLAGRRTKLILKKQIYDGTAIAIAVEN